jgi:AcrR family transcriptional regulator
MSTPVKPTPPDVRDAIIDAAVQLFKQNGYEATSLNYIMDAIGMTKGAFYYHFESKDDLLLTIHSTFIEQELDAVTRIDREQEDPRDALRHVIIMIIESVEQYGSYMTVFFEQRRRLSHHHFREVKRKRDAFQDKIVEIVERGIASGLFKDAQSSHVLAFGIIGMCTWAYQWYRPNGEMSAREIGNLYADLVLQGLLSVDV